ncbi:hypothetical protein C6503_11715 [Candidatus Poribacteria bacterium]|nr:MAG: hypothetical protein C6503_11715 [Candidatus Poribacteria bacterium]
MRLLTYAALIVCVIVITLFLYLEHYTKQFAKELQSPVVPKTSPPARPTVDAADPVSIEATPVVDTQDNPRNVDEADTDTDVHQTDHQHPHEQTTDTNTQAEASDDSDPNDTQIVSGPDPQAELLEKDPPKPFETLKKKLIKEHGDIPLVHRYIELRKKELNREPMTMEEVSSLWDAIMVFNPTPANKKSYELIKRLSSQADPGTFKVIYDPEEVK